MANDLLDLNNIDQSALRYGHLNNNATSQLVIELFNQLQAKDHQIEKLKKKLTGGYITDTEFNIVYNEYPVLKQEVENSQQLIEGLKEAILISGRIKEKYLKDIERLKEAIKKALKYQYHDEPNPFQILKEVLEGDKNDENS
mgnify:FL=1